jgi:hypothetical protein
MKKSCEFCESSNTSFIQDEKSKTTLDGAQYGIFRRDDCGQIMFWFYKAKSKFKISPDNSEITYDAIPKLKFICQWDGTITPFTWSYIYESSEKTGRPTTSYYTIHDISGKNGVDRDEYQRLLDRLNNKYGE